ncbi:hypothetical protein GCM10027615_55430 [Plantactinospora veratri]
MRRTGATSGSPRALATLIADYTRRTAGSRRLAATHRPVLADNDNRVMSDFRMAIKEMVYPIAAERSAGARLWDVDGNEYVDVMMGYGSNLFGHSPPFVTDAIREQLDRGVHIGVQSDRAGEVAGLLAGLTGAARVAFCNSGSEAVMMALRLARAATGRTRVAMFAGSYHGIYDGTLGSMRRLRPDLPPAPVAPGIPQRMVDDLVILPYADEAALRTLRAQGGDLAAVLVEPVQSRRPDIQPGWFLRELRELTAGSGVALVFDEIVTGLRTRPGGAQEWFGVRADLATYGKVLGGGLPIGAVAGDARFLDAVDGGTWSYGDDSFPSAETTFFAGTFCKHPLAMAAASAMLAELTRRGPELHDALNRRTAEMVERLNGFFVEEAVPIRVAHFGSLFRFFSTQDIHLLYYHLVLRGVHAREGHNAFLSAAHTDEDVDRIVHAVREGVTAMRAAGLLPAGEGPVLHTPAAPSGKPARDDRVPEPAAVGADDRAHPSHVVRDDDPTYPLTAAQRQLWTVAQLDPQASVAYHQTSVLRLHGDLDLDALRGAVRAVVARHEALRTVFDDDQARWQRVLPAAEVDVPLVRVPPERGADVPAWLAERERRPFDLTAGPLVRLAAVPTGPDEHLLALTVHHIVADGWSVGLVLQEIGAAYTARRRGQAWQPPPARPFRAYVTELAERLTGPAAAATERYWLERMAGPPPELDLPTDRPRPAARTMRGARYTTTLETDLVNRLRAVGAPGGSTLLMVLLSAYQVLLHRLTGQPDVVVGVPVNGRGAAGTQTTVGHCLDVLPIRATVDADEPFTALLRQVSEHLLDAYERQDHPSGLLAERLGVRVDPARTPLFRTVFNLDRTVRPPELAGLRVEEVELPVAHAQFDLGVNGVESGDGWRLDLDYSTDVLDEATVARWAGHLVTLLRAVAEDPRTPVGRLPLESGSEWARTLARWNGTDTPYPRDRTLPELFAAQVARTPEATCLVDGERVLTYRELDRRTSALAAQLARRGVRTGQVVGVCLPRGVDAVVAILATLRAGAAYLPLDPAQGPERLGAVLADSGSRLVVTDPAWAPPDLPVPVLDVSAAETGAESGAGTEAESEADPDSAEAAGGPVGPEDAAFVIYTSGSTGRPKGVLGTHRAVVNRLHWSWQTQPYEPGEVCCQKTAATFVDSVAELFGPLLGGVPLVVLPAEVTGDPAGLVRALAAHRVSRIVLVPSLLRVVLHILEGTGERLPALRRWTVSGEALTADLVTHFRRLLPDATLLNLYGTTEVMGDATGYQAGVEAGAVPIGRPLANTRVQVLDRAGQRVPVGVVGELYVGGDGLARGYLNAPARTAERFVPDPFGPPGTRLYRTGDLARWRVDGQLEYVGRTDHQVKIDGVRVEPAEAESALHAHPAVRAGAVVARPTASGGHTLVAFVEPHPGADPAGIADFLRGRLPGYLVPAAVVPVPALPLTTSGKVDRARLHRFEVPEPGGDPVAPRTPVEEALHDIWTDVLGRRRVSVEANFFDLGATSLNLMQVVARIRTVLGVEIPVRDLFTAATLAGMAEAVESALLAGAARDDGVADLLAQLERMTDEEAERELNGSAAARTSQEGTS